MGRDIGTARANLEASIPTISTRYQQGIQSNTTWLDRASSDAAEAAWGAGVQAAVAAKKRQAGIRRAGQAAWQQAALSKGVAAIGNGVRAGLNKYQTNFGPVLQAMNQAAQTLPPRSPDMMANIQNRLVPIAKAAQAAAMR